MKSRAPSGVGLKRIGVSISRKPPLSIVRLIAETIVLRSRDVALHLRAAQVEPAVAEAQRLVDVLLVELERAAASSVETISRVSTWSSTSPVGMFGLTASGARRTTSPSGAQDELVADRVADLRRLRARARG